MGSKTERFQSAEEALWRVEGATPEEQWVDLPKLGTKVRVLAVGEGPPVLFVHGASNGATSWAPLAARLPGFRCLLLDRPGCGLSEPPSDPSLGTDVDAFATYAETLLVDVLDGLGLGVEAVPLVATSLGGYFALRTAAAHADRVRSLVMLGWTIGAPIGRTPLVMRITAVRSLGRLMTRLPLSHRMARSMMAQVGLRQAIEAGRLPREAIEWFRSQLNDTDTMRNELDFSPPIMDLRHGINESILLPDEVLGAVKAPALFLWGAEDLFGGPEIAGPFVARVPNARLELVPGAGHAVWMDDADGIAQSVRTFLTATAGL